MSTPELRPEDQEFFDRVRSSKSPEEWASHMAMHLISWQKSEREQINSFFKTYSKPIYEVVELTRQRMDKLEDAQSETNQQLRDIVQEVKHMVKCVDKAILESKEDKKHYYKQHEETHRELNSLDKRVTTIEAKSDVRWPIIATVGTAALTLVGGSILVFIKGAGS